MTDVKYSEPEPQLIGSPWNRLAIVAFIFPLVVFGLIQLVGHLLPQSVAPDGSTTAQLIKALTVEAIISGVIEALIYAVGVVLGHLSLSRARRGLRGRGFGIAGLILSYLGVALSLLAIVGVLALPALMKLANMS